MCPRTMSIIVTGGIRDARSEQGSSALGAKLCAVDS